MIGKKLQDILVCPRCRGKFDSGENEDGLTCSACGLLYEIRDQIPILLVGEAGKLDINEPQKAESPLHDDRNPLT